MPDTHTPLPLAGIRVLDLTLARAGPTCVRHLADWGAEVIRVEPPTGDDALGNPREGYDFQNLHRNKRSIALNLKDEAGLAAFYKLAAKADVVVENMRMQVKYRLKVGPDDLRAINPRLIYASISGFGQTGPYSTRGGVDQIAQGMGGLMSITGLPGQGPVRVGIPIADLTAGNLLALGVIMALYERVTTGKGKHVTTSLLESMVFMLDFQASRYLMAGEVAGQAGNDHPVNSPMGVFQTADKLVNIAASSTRLWTVFCKAAGRGDWLENPKWKTAQERTADRPALNAAIAEQMRKHSAQWWIDTLEEAGIPCGPVNDIAEVFADPQVQHLRMALPMGDTHVVDSAINIEGHETSVHSLPPRLGQHSEEILLEAGVTRDEIAALRARNAIL